MGKGIKTGGADFKPGNPGGPGRPKLPDDVKEAQQLSKSEFIRIATDYLFMAKAQIIRRMNDPNTPAIELIVGSIISKSISQGDSSRLNFLLDRMIGKVNERIQVTGANDGPIRTIDESLSEEELDRRAAVIMKRLQDKFKNEP